MDTAGISEMEQRVTLLPRQIRLDQDHTVSEVSLQTTKGQPVLPLKCRPLHLWLPQCLHFSLQGREDGL